MLGKAASTTEQLCTDLTFPLKFYAQVNSVYMVTDVALGPMKFLAAIIAIETCLLQVGTGHMNGHSATLDESLFLAVALQGGRT